MTFRSEDEIWHAVELDGGDEIARGTIDDVWQQLDGIVRARPYRIERIVGTSEPHPREAAEKAVLLRFVPIMRAKMRARRHHGDWRSSSFADLFKLLIAEAQELESAIGAIRLNGYQSTGFPSPTDALAVAEEAADVANYAAMIADRAFAMAAEAREARDE